MIMAPKMTLLFKVTKNINSIDRKPKQNYAAATKLQYVCGREDCLLQTKKHRTIALHQQSQALWWVWMNA